MIQYKGFTITTKPVPDGFTSKAVQGATTINSKRFTGPSGARRSVAHCKRMIDKRYN